MALHVLTPAELDFLTAPPVEPDGLPARLTRKLAVTLTARLRLTVGLVLQPAGGTAADPRTPTWHADDALAVLWLTRRLGGRRVTGSAPFVPHGLIETLDAALAEAWLGGIEESVPSTLAWHLHTDLVRATLAVHLPQLPTDMTRWARGVIRHG